MLENVDPTYAKVRIAAYDAQIKDLRAQIRNVEKKKSLLKNAAPSTDDDSTESND